MVQVSEWEYLYNGIALKMVKSIKVQNYDEEGNLYDLYEGNKTGQTIVLESLGKPLLKRWQTCN